MKRFIYLELLLLLISYSLFAVNSSEKISMQYRSGPGVSLKIEIYIDEYNNEGECTFRLTFTSENGPVQIYESRETFFLKIDGLIHGFKIQPDHIYYEELTDNEDIQYVLTFDYMVPLAIVQKASNAEQLRFKLAGENFSVTEYISARNKSAMKILF